MPKFSIIANETSSKVWRSWIEAKSRFSDQRYTEASSQRFSSKPSLASPTLAPNPSYNGRRGPPGRNQYRDPVEMATRRPTAQQLLYS